MQLPVLVGQFELGRRIADRDTIVGDAYRRECYDSDRCHGD
jgi:hypothetical protein